MIPKFVIRELPFLQRNNPFMVRSRYTYFIVFMLLTVSLAYLMPRGGFLGAGGDDILSKIHFIPSIMKKSCVLQLISMFFLLNPLQLL